MAEVVMIPIVPALLNAIHDATGRRFQSLPVTQSHAQGSARVTTLPSPSTAAPSVPWMSATS
jgi:hypothetical protein